VIRLFCSRCSIEVDQRVEKYSLEYYGRVLCRDCQKLPEHPAEPIFEEYEETEDDILACSLCDDEISQRVYDYSIKNFGSALCRVCQRGSKKENIEPFDQDEKDSTYDYNLVKGRIAESLIEQLFLKLGYNVFRYGMENTVPGIMKLLTGVRSDVAESIRRMPDFVVQHPHNKEVFFIEVKYRANGKFSFEALPENYPFENAYFVVVSKKHIKCISYSELKAGENVAPGRNRRFYLGSRKEFETDKETIIEFCEYAVKFFSNV